MAMDTNSIRDSFAAVKAAAGESAGESRRWRDRDRDHSIDSLGGDGRGEWGGSRSYKRTPSRMVHISEWVGPDPEPEERRAIRVEVERIEAAWKANRLDAMRRRRVRRQARLDEHLRGGHTYHADCPTCWSDYVAAQDWDLGWMK